MASAVKHRHHFHSATRGGRDAFVTTWHMSAFEYIETEYAFNGKIFQKTASRNIRSEENR